MSAKFYDMKARAVRVQIGDKVLVKIPAHAEEKQKLADKFEEEVYTMFKQMRKSSESESGKLRTLHRNHLCLVIDQDEAEK